MTEATGRRRRPRGGVETLPSGALRVRVYVGTDPVSGRRHYLKEVVPAGPDVEWRADAVRVKFLAEISEGCNPRTSATVKPVA
jgi:integrase